MILVPGIKVRDNESFDEAYRRFKKQCDRNLIVTETRARRYFEPMTEIRKKQTPINIPVLGCNKQSMSIWDYSRLYSEFQISTDIKK